MVKKYPIIVSIKHEYCELIYKGFKSLELRKTHPENDEFLAYIYDTSLKHITGLMDISGIQEITEINDTLCKNACVSPDFARQYKEKGKGKLYAWNIESSPFCHRNFSRKVSPQSLFHFYINQGLWNC